MTKVCAKCHQMKTWGPHLINFCDECVKENLSLHMLDAISYEWKLCKRRNGKYEIEVWFKGDDGWSRCAEADTAVEAISKAVETVV